MLRMLRVEEERWRRPGVGCVAPVREWRGLESVGSRRTPEVEEVVEATEAECWARRAESSRVRRLTYADVGK